MTSTIAVIDDRRDARETIALAIDLELPKGSGWRVINQSPLASLEDYPHWLLREGVGVLVIDERLQEQKDPLTNELAVYNGHDVARFLRGHGLQVPVYAVTSYAEEREIQDSREHFDGVHDRKAFTDAPAKLVPSFIRSGQRFLEQFEKELAQFTDLSAKVAAGKGSSDDTVQLRALQGKLGTAFSIETEAGRIEVLDSLEKKLDELEILRAKIEEALQVKKE